MEYNPTPQPKKETHENSEEKDNSKEKQINDIDNETLLKQIFQTSKSDNSKCIPFLLKKGTKIIKKIFTSCPDTADYKTFYDYILKKIDLIKKIKEIIGNSYEILYIIFDYISQQNTSPFIYFIDLYLNYIALSNNELNDEKKKKIIEEIKDIFSWFISCGLLTRKSVDYIYQKIALFQLEKRFNLNLFNEMLSLLEIIYGKYCNKPNTENLIAKKYIYFCDKENSYIKTNISQSNSIFIKNGFYMILWFYLNNYEESPKCSLCEIKTNNNEQINIVINDNYDIDIQYNDSIILKEQENKNFKLKQKIWAQLKIEFNYTGLSLYLFQNNTNEGYSENKLYEKKIYCILNSKESESKNENINNNINYIENFHFENFYITNFVFFKNYLGIVNCILFFNKLTTNEKNMTPIESLYGLENKKINEFISDIKLFSGLYFIISSSLYLYDQNKIIDSANNVTAQLPERPYEKGKDEYNLNSILNFHNYINNIFYLGGCNNILPLFEIFYKFSLEENNINYLKEIFNKLFHLLEIIFIDRKKNAICPMKKEILFFDTIQLFMEKIDIKYYYDNENLLQMLINLANFFNKLKINKMFKLKEDNGIFINIIYNPNILMKFNLSLQEKLLKEMENYLTIFPFEKFNILLLLLSEKYTNDELKKKEYLKTLFHYISKNFESNKVDDAQRESLFLLYKNKSSISSNNIRLLDCIFIHIMETFILYLDLGVNIKSNETGIKRRKTTVNNLLYSNNNFIENLLNYLSETNIHVKTVIINFLRILTQTYGDIIEQYFIKFGKKKKDENRINKKEFYEFINENIAPNYSNEDILEETINPNKKNEKDVSIFYLEEDDKNENQRKDDKNKDNINNKNISKKLERKRSKSIGNIKKKKKEDNSKLEEILVKRNNSFSKKFKRNFIEKVKNLHKSKKIIDQNKSLLKLEEKEEKNINKINLIKKQSFLKYLTDEEKIVIQDTKLQISLILYNWLSSLISEKEKQKKVDNQIEESIQHVIDYIVKLISYSKELEVINRTLLLIWDQKTINKSGMIKDSENTYYKLLFYLSKNPLFIQILIELLINSYIYKNLEKDKKDDYFILINKSKEDTNKLKQKKINLIYNQSKELLIDIFFDERNINRNNIIIQMFCIILKISKGFEDNVDEYKRNLLFQFLKELFLEICENYNKFKFFRLADYIDLFCLFIEYSFLLKTADDYMKNIYKKIKDDCTHCFPDFLIFGIIYEYKVSEWSGYDIYKIIYNNIRQIFNIEKVFKEFEFIYKDFKDNSFDRKKDIFIYDIDIVKALVPEIIYNKKKKEYKINQNALFYSYRGNGYENNFPLINILSLFNSLCLYLFYADINEKKKIDLVSLLNDFQNYIIYLILFSLIIEPSNHSAKIKSYDDMQKLIYKNIFFNIKNIINHLNDKNNLSKYLKILHNIILFLSIIYKINQTETKKKNSGTFLTNIFSLKIDISRSAPILLIQFLMKHNGQLFNEENFNFFINNKKENKEKALELIQQNIKRDIIDNPSFDLFQISIFEKIVQKRDSDLKLKLRLLITDEKEFNKAVNNYKKIFLKVKKFKNVYNIDQTKQNQDELFKLKNYRKIKKDLYSFNNSYSNLEVFYNLKNLKENEKKYLLKYKICNFLSKDMTRKILKPIIDMNYYLPNFRKYNYESNQIYYHQNNRVYSVDLQIFDKGGNPPLSPNVKNEYDKILYYIEENVCYIKTMNHIKGKIFHFNHLENMEYIYFCMTKLPSEEELKKDYEDYDSLNKSCFSSLFRNNLNKKDLDIYLKIKFSEIYFIFNRKYCFRDNSLEIYTSNHRSYYFKFKNNEKRNKFLEHLLSLLNKDSSMFKKLYKPIYSINENNKKITLGYYKDVENNNEYSSISSIKELWKDNKISTLEYFMWINVYGNRSYRDISQYPVFPWIIDEYKTNTFQEIKDKDFIRNFKIPMGMMSLNEKGKERAEGYISNYKFMSLELKEEKIVDFKVKEEEEIEEEKADNIEQNNKEVNAQKPKNEIVSPKKDNIIEDLTTNNINTSDLVNDIITQDPIIKKNKNLPKIPKYNYNIEKIYTNLSVTYEQIPYCFGSHYSNGMYVSHFLGRLFPYCLTMIEIQGTGFDCSERLFLCLDKTFLSSTNEKCDIRELIPEFYTMPEILLNVNELNFGEISLDNFSESINYLEEIVSKDNAKSKVKVQDVLLPNWCKFNPYLFIQKKREMFESKLEMNPWIDLIFGFTQRGMNAQEVGNLFMPYVYDGVMNYRLKDKDILEQREDTEYQLRLFELGVNPTKVFDKRLTDIKKNVKDITNIKKVDMPVPYIEGFDEKIVLLSNVGNSYNNLFIYSKRHKTKKIIIDDKLDINANYMIKDSVDYKDLSLIFKIDISSKLIIKNLFKSNIILIAGFYNGNLYLINLDNNSKINNSTLYSKVRQEDQVLIQNYGKGIITALEISKDDKYIAYGNNKGTLVIVGNDNNIVLENNENKKFKILKIISSHSGYIINSISINTDLNLLADCSYDNYVHIYTLPKCEKINSIFIKNKTFNADFIFLSAQPLASIILYSNKLYEFKCYSINGHNLNVEHNDRLLYDELRIKTFNEPMVSPVIFTDSVFIDYLLYVFGFQFILLRKMPEMDIIFKINFDKNELISLVNISLCKECIYAVDNNNKRIHIIKYKYAKSKKQISDQISFDNNNNNK